MDFWLLAQPKLIMEGIRLVLIKNAFLQADQIFNSDFSIRSHSFNSGLFAEELKIILFHLILKYRVKKEKMDRKESR